MIRFQNICKYFQGRKVIDDLTFSVEEGETLVLLGKSGSGKTTMLKMINRLVTPDRGSIFFKNTNIMDIKVQLLRRDIGYVFQAIGLFPHMTVAENIAVVPRLLGWQPARIAAQVDNLLARMALPGEFYSRYPHELSGGQQQRVGIARALAGEPSLLLMDEPFGALDPIVRKDLQNDFLKLAVYNGLTKIIVTHDVKEAFALGDRIAIIDNGRLIQPDSPRRLLQTSNTLVNDFLGEEVLSLKLSQVSVKELLPYISVSLDGSGNAETVSIEDKPLLRIFANPGNAGRQIHLIDGDSSVGYVKPVDLQIAYLKFDQQQQAYD